MDYAEMLFAYHVRVEAMKSIFERFPDGITNEELNIEIDETVRGIVKSTSGIAERIQQISSQNSLE